MKKIVVGLVGLLCFVSAFAQEIISYNGSGNFILIEKTDLRRYDNGKYTGLVSREISSYISPVSTDGGYLYEGNFFVWQDTVRASMSVMSGINEAIPSVFKISHDGVLTMIEDHGYPSLRSFPSYSDKSIKIGDVWQAKAERAVDPLNKGIVTKMPIYVEYKYIGDTTFNGEACYNISAQWATRYGMGGGVYHIDWGGDQDLQKATGSHKANIIVSKASGNALVIKDMVDETFVYSDGSQIQFKGTISQFTQYPPAVDRSKLIPALKRIANISKEDEKAIMEGKVTADEKSTGTSGTTKTTEAAETKSLSKSVASSGDSIVSNESTSSSGSTASKDALASSNLNASKGNNKLDKLKKGLGTETYVGSSSSASIEDSVVSTGSSNATSNQHELVTVDTTPAGIRLTIPNLQFKPDSAELLGGEKDRIDKIAQVLKEVPECKLLIEGHTAAVGKEAGELQLSKERAQAIAQALIARGIPAERLIIKGSGGKKPVADNSTAEGKAKNRRVEITILD